MEKIGRNEYNVLIVDDSPERIKGVREALRNGDIAVAAATDGSQALNIIEQSPPDLILLEKCASGFDSFETCRQLKENPATEAVPVIFIGPKTEPSNKIQGYTFGAVDYITRPVEPEELMARVNAHLRIGSLIRKMEEVNAELEQNEHARTLQLTRKNEEWRKSKERFRSLVEITSDWIWEVDQFGVYTYVSSKVEDLLGYTPDEVVGKTPFDLMPQAEAERVGAIFADIAKSRRPFQGLENTNVHKDGRLVILETSGVPILDADGSYSGYRGIERDITERKQAEEALRTSEQRFRNIVESLPMGIMLYDLETDGRLVFKGTNPSANTILGVDCRQFIGQTIEEALPPLAETDLPDRYRRVAEQGKTDHWEQIEYDHAGICGAFEIWAFQTEAGSMACIIQDITERKRAEVELRHERDRAQTYLDIAGAMFVLIDAQQKVRLINKAGCRVLGYDEDEVVGKNWFDNFLPDNNREEVKSVFNRILTGELEAVEFFENPVLTKTGEQRIIAWHNTLIRNDEGDPVAALSSGEDITERRRAEEVMAERERYYRTLLFTLQEDLVVIDRDYKITDVNNSFLVTTGCRRDEVIGRDCFGVAHWYRGPCDEHGELCRLQDVFDTGRPYNFDRVHLQKDGAKIRVNTLLSPLRDADGDVTHVVEAVRDISDLMRVQDELQESEERYRHLVETMNDGVVMMDENHRVTYANPRMTEMLGYAADELVGQRIGGFFDEANRAVLKELLSIPEEAEHGAHEVEWSMKGGNKIITITSTKLIFDEDGRHKGGFAVVTDVTEQKRLQEQFHQAQRIETVGRLASGIAHDFNNMLLPILCYSDMVLEELMPADPRYDHVVEIKRAAVRSRDLTQRLLAFSRKQVLELKPLDLREVVISCEKMIRATIREDIEIEVIMGDSEVNIRGDISQIEQILMNLAVNAQDAMPGKGRLTIEVSRVEITEAWAKRHGEAKPGLYVLLSVSDAGSGMDADTVAHIFEPFFTTKEVGKGTGLGLAAVYGIVSQHGGRITVDSEPEKGTSFKMYFPATDEAVVPVESHPVERQAGTSDETLMVVEDEDLVRDLVCSILDPEGYTILCAPDANTCLEIIRERREPIDLLITDVVMPKMNGVELYNQLLGDFPELRVLFLSGYTDDVIADRGILAEGAHFIQKPFSIKTLTGKVREVLDG